MTTNINDGELWHIRPIEGTKYNNHWQPEIKGDLEIRPGGHQAFRLRYDHERQGLVVLMMGLAHKHPVTGKRFLYSVIVEDWREVAFIPFQSIVEPDPRLCDSECYKWVIEQGKPGSDAFPDVTPFDPDVFYKCINGCSDPSGQRFTWFTTKGEQSANFCEACATEWRDRFKHTACGSSLVISKPSGENTRT